VPEMRWVASLGVTAAAVEAEAVAAAAAGALGDAAGVVPLVVLVGALARRVLAPRVLIVPVGGIGRCYDPLRCYGGPALGSVDWGGGSGGRSDAARAAQDLRDGGGEGGARGTGASTCTLCPSGLESSRNEASGKIKTTNRKISWRAKTNRYFAPVPSHSWQRPSTSRNLPRSSAAHHSVE
jgi:hypothetical protein